MKNRCYPKYSYIILIVLAIIMALFSFGPLVIRTNENSIIINVWSISMLVFSIVFVCGALYYMQYFEIKDNHIIIKSVFGEIVKLPIDRVNAYVESLPTYFSWTTTINLKWICIYDKQSPRSLKQNLNMVAQIKKL